MPGLLGDDETFSQEISDPVRTGTRSTASPPEIALATSRCKVLYDLIAPYFMRRTSGGQANIKSKSDIVLWTDMGEKQRKLYDEVEGAVKLDKEQKGTKFKRNHELFSVIAGSHEACGPNMKLGKMKVLKRLIKQFVVKDGERVGIFYKYKTLLRRTEKMLTKRGIGFVTITGETNAKTRQNAIDAMNDPDSSVKVLLATSRSASHGINLFLTSKLVILEASWNGSVDNQAAVSLSQWKRQLLPYSDTRSGQRRVYRHGRRDRPPFMKCAFTEF